MDKRSSKPSSAQADRAMEEYWRREEMKQMPSAYDFNAERQRVRALKRIYGGNLPGPRDFCMT